MKITRECTCDEVADGPCPAHKRENELQDALIAAKNRIVELEEYNRSPTSKVMNRAKGMQTPTIEKIREIGKRYSLRVDGCKLILDDPFDEGYFGAVYRLSPRRVAKVHFIPTDISWEELLCDEIEGSFVLRSSLPILSLIGAYVPLLDSRGFLHVGLVKRYIPFSVSERDIRHFRKSGEVDCKRTSYRKDSRGRVYRVDTQKLGFLEE